MEMPLIFAETRSTKGLNSYAVERQFLLFNILLWCIYWRFLIYLFCASGKDGFLELAMLWGSRSYARGPPNSMAMFSSSSLLFYYSLRKEP
jgi:hypothetical protein